MSNERQTLEKINTKSGWQCTSSVASQHADPAKSQSKQAVKVEKPEGSQASVSNTLQHFLVTRGSVNEKWGPDKKR